MSADPQILIDKVKWDGTKVRIEYQRGRQKDDRYDELAIASFDLPRPQFEIALQALKADVCAICELNEAYATDGFTVRGVSFSRTNDVLGAVITALKAVKTAPSPVVLNTPHLPVAPYGDDGGGPLLPPETVARLEILIEEAIAYIRGDRLQPSLLPPQGESST